MRSGQCHSTDPGEGLTADEQVANQLKDEGQPDDGDIHGQEGGQNHRKSLQPLEAVNQFLHVDPLGNPPAKQTSVIENVLLSGRGGISQSDV